MHNIRQYQLPLQRYMAMMDLQVTVHMAMMDPGLCIFPIVHSIADVNIHFGYAVSVHIAGRERDTFLQPPY
jgi:hypothetical protein